MEYKHKYPLDIFMKNVIITMYNMGIYPKFNFEEVQK